jgi:glycosyltransferase involved in cell wall biosynthesis
MCELGHDPCGGSEVVLKEDVELLRNAGIPVRVYGRASRPGTPVTELQIRTKTRLISSLEYCGQFRLREPRALLLSYNEPTVAALAPGRSIVRFDFTTPLPQYWRIPGCFSRFKKSVYLFPSESEKRIFQEAHELIPENCSSVIPYAIDCDVFRPCQQNRLADSRVGFAGQFIPGKGVGVLLDAWKIVKAQVSKSALSLAGGSNLWKNGAAIRGAATIGQRVAEMAASGQLTMVGELKRSEMSAFWNSVTIAVVPSLCEAFGFVALEALACGVPVVASNLGGLREIVQDGQSGILVPPNDPEALAKALISLLTNEALRGQLATGARRRATEFSLANRSKRLIGLLRQRIEVNETVRSS